MSTICIIPARGGSQRIPLKNIKEFHGQPIIAYSIQKAEDSGLFDRIIVSTDSATIATIVEQYGVEVYMRDPAYGADDVGTQAVVKECLEGMQIEPFDYICCLYATAPLMSIKDLCAGYSTVSTRRCTGQDRITYVMSVGTEPLQDAGQFYWGEAIQFLLERELLDHSTRFIYVDPERVCDINTMDDWNRALKLYEGIRK